jgi:peptide/nickel transport system substrate-binding protein
MVVGIGLSACATAEAPVQEQGMEQGEQGAPPEQQQGAVTEEEAAAPEAPTTSRTGAWVDSVVVIEEPNADKAITRLDAGELDVYAYTISSPSTADKIMNDDNLDYKTSYGSYNELTFNPSQCADEAQLNPFAVPRIREAMNYLIDRQYLVDEIMGGLGTPRWVAINTASADRGRLAAQIRAIEAEYAYNPDKANEIITEEMQNLGAEMVDGKWTYNGEPVTIKGIIRTEDERKEIGDYVANQLEDIGFTVTRDYKTSSEAAPIWQQSEPSECLFNYYTGGWVSTAISRDAGGNFLFFYTPSGLPRPLWQAYTPDPEFEAIAQRLNDNDFTSMEERKELFEQALPMSMKDSVRVWLLDRSSVAPLRKEVSVASDLSGSIYGTPLWPYTLRFKDQEGGTINWASASILTEPWNPIAGTNWIYDTALIRATGEWSFMTDPNTGLAWPQRFESVVVTVKDGLPVTKTLDWVDLQFESEITVPDDAWVDWDAEGQTFITASEYFTQTDTVTATQKVVTTYPADLFDTIKWHDGSSLSLGDMVLMLIMQFDQAKEASPIYDAAMVPGFESFMSAFKGIKIASTDPLTIEYYTDNWTLDAENAVGNFVSLWPYYGYGEAPWESIAIGVKAEEEGLAAFSADKATENNIEQLSYIAGPTLEILSTKLTESQEAGYLPYEPTMNQFVTPEEITERYESLANWYGEKGHFWVGTGPFYLEKAYPVEKTVELKYNPDFPDPSDKWSRFSEPAISIVEIDGPAHVTTGEAATFDVYVTYSDQPYAIDDIESVSYLVFDATGQLVDQGDAAAVEDGKWQVELSSDITSGLESGSNRLEVVVVSKLVALPSLGSFEFVTTPSE